jgi:hypothetical protein
MVAKHKVSKLKEKSVVYHLLCARLETMRSVCLSLS